MVFFWGVIFRQIYIFVFVLWNSEYHILLLFAAGKKIISTTTGVIYGLLAPFETVALHPQVHHGAHCADTNSTVKQYQ